jgi:alpha-beta hydrolase superfamily lysophospholipase
MLYVGIALLILLVFMIGISVYLVIYAMKNMHHHSLEDSRAWQEHHYDLSWYDSMEKTDYTVTCGDGYILHAQFLPNPVPTDRYVLITHGFTDNHYGSLKYARIYLDNGFNVIIYDLRGHGMNSKTITTFTILEREDLYAMILDSRRRYPDMKVLGLHGESLGAGTTVAVLEKKPPVDFAVVDCGFYDMVPVFEVAIRSYHLPVFMVKVASACAKVIYGYSFRQMRPIEALADNQLPLLFMHGSCD